MLCLPAARTLAVGLSLSNHIAGAAGAAIDSVWVLSGIHATELGGDTSRAVNAAAEAGLAPKAILRSLSW